MIVALVFNYFVEEQLKKIAPYLVVFALLETFFYIQVETTDAEEMPQSWKLFILNFIACVSGGTVINLFCWSCKFGSTVEELKERMVEIEGMREELL